MDKYRYQKTHDIDCTRLVCDSCPAFLRSASIIFDKDKNRSLLQILIGNQYDSAILSVTLRIICYDKYGNIVPDEGRNSKTCCFPNVSLLAKQDSFVKRFVPLSSNDVVDCDIFIIHVILENGSELSFSEDDFAIKKRIMIPSAKKTKGRQADDSFRASEKMPAAKKIRLAVTLGIVAIIAVYLAVVLGSFFIKNVAIPGKISKTANDYADAHEYDKAIAYAKSESRDDLAENIASQAAEYYFSVQDYDNSVKYIELQSDDDKIATLFVKIVQSLSENGDYERAVRFASDSKITSLYSETTNKAVHYYASEEDYEKADKYIILSGNTSGYSDVYDKAAKFYLASGDEKTAAGYAVKAGKATEYQDLYSKVVSSCRKSGDYGQAALLIAGSGNMTTSSVTEDIINDTYSNTSVHFIRKNISVFCNSLPLDQKIRINRSVISIYTDAVAANTSGKVVGSNLYTWTDIRSICIGANHIAGIKADGSAVATGDNTYQQCGVAVWDSIIDIDVGEYHTVGVKADGTVIAVGLNKDKQCDVFGFRNAISIAAGKSHTVVLHADGTATAVGSNEYGQCNVSEWTDIIQIAAGEYHTVGLKSDGTVVAVGLTDGTRCATSEWQDIVEIAAGDTHTVGIKSDGTAVSTGDASCGDISGWNNLIAVEAGKQNTIGLKADGSVLIAGDGSADISNLLNIDVK